MVYYLLILMCCLLTIWEIFSLSSVWLFEGLLNCKLIDCYINCLVVSVLIGDRQVLFADKVLKFTSSGKIKRRILIVTDFALYVVDPETYSLKRRITLAAVEKLYLSKLCDNFFAIVIPTEYDILMASTRKNEIVTVLVDAAKNASNFELDVIFKDRYSVILIWQYGSVVCPDQIGRHLVNFKST